MDSNQNGQQVTVQELIYLLGSKELQIHLMNKQIALLQQAQQAQEQSKLAQSTEK